MKLQKNICIGVILIVLYGISLIGCGASTQIAMDPTVKTGQIESTLLVKPYPAAVTVQQPADFGLKIAYKGSEKRLLKFYNNVDLKEVIRESFKEKFQHNKMTVVVNTEVDDKAIVEKSFLETEEKPNPVAECYDFSKSAEEIKTKYILVINVLEWGINAETYACRIEYTASLYSKDSTKPLWMVHRWDEKGVKGRLLAITDFGKDDAVAQKNARLYVKTTALEMVNEILTQLTVELSK